MNVSEPVVVADRDTPASCGADLKGIGPVRRAPARELEDLGERIAELAAQISAATYELLVMLREFDERAGWNTGFRSCAHWLNWRVGLDLGAAREKVRVARALAALPLLSEAMRRGEVSYSKVRAVTRVATPATEGELLLFARAGTAAHVERLVRGLRLVARIEEGDFEKRRHDARHLRAYTDEDGMVVVTGRLAPEAGAALLRALEAGVEQLYGPRRVQPPADGGGAPEPTVEVSAGQRRADALGLVAESALAAGLDPGTRGDRYQVVVHVDAEALRADGEGGSSCLADGSRVSAETSRRLACDSALVVMQHAADGRVLDDPPGVPAGGYIPSWLDTPPGCGDAPAVGRRTRTVSPGLRRALDHRDHGPAHRRNRAGWPLGRRRAHGRHSRRVVAASRAAAGSSATLITSSTGPTAARPASRTPCFCADSTMARCTRRDTRWSWRRTAKRGSIGRMGGCCPKRRRCRWWPGNRSPLSSRGSPVTAWPSMAGRRSRPGKVGRSTMPGRSIGS